MITVYDYHYGRRQIVITQKRQYPVPDKNLCK